MTYASRETSQYSGQPFELFLFQTAEQVWRLTSSDKVRTYMGEHYAPTALTHSEPNQGVELASGSIKLQLPADHEIALLFRAYIPVSPLWLTIYRAHEGEADSETVTYWTGKVTKATFAETCELECVPEQQALKKSVPCAVFGSQCNRVLYDAGCGVSRLAFRVQGTLLSVAGDQIAAPEFAARPSGWWVNGYVEFGSERRMIIRHVGPLLTLMTGMASLAVGAQVFVYAGCNRKSSDCAGKFSNLVNFFGFEWVPTKNPFNGVQ
jgi:uncharacterized phage protein (TIGR02218 family)